MKYVFFCFAIIAALSFQKSHSINDFPEDYLANHFDWPVGKPDGEGYYNAQPFGKNNHLGEDLNANSGGNSDLGDPIYSIANGYVSFAKDIDGGWGNVIRIIHQLPDGSRVESLYAHCNEIKTKQGAWLKRGDQIGTIGDAHGQYYAHLHFELRSAINMPIGGGYSTDQNGYLNPLNFIELHR